MDGVRLAVEDLSYTYPGRSRRAVDGMSFEVGAGEVFGFLGPSGAGKTTTQRAVLGLLVGWTGHVEVLGRDLRAWGRELYDHVGVAFELPVGYPRLTGREDLAHFRNLHRRRAGDPAELLARVGLADAADEPVASYSKGMRIRLNLARALLHDPAMIFLDEPTSGLDPVNAEQVRLLVRAEQARGRSVFLSTHDMATAAAVCDRVAFVIGGRIALCAAPRALQLAYGRREVQVEYRTDTGLHRRTFPLEPAAAELHELLASGRVETMHTAEASLDEVFTRVTGATL
ncbi:ABC transporter ATP-binding protein [Egicoccus sp. AB-alg6-2]|uniref:ABC transporter ATP-binding protein n=1 Tax=Egicoccus sp. AB-alg6-2 TaxID=3242692 RepID=UPI00359EB85D